MEKSGNEYDCTFKATKVNNYLEFCFTLAGMFENIRQKPSIVFLKIYPDNCSGLFFLIPEPSQNSLN